MSSNNTVGLGLLTILPINFTITTAGRELHIYRYIESESIYIYITHIYTAHTTLHSCMSIHVSTNQSSAIYCPESVRQIYL